MCELWSQYLSLERVSGIILPPDDRPHQHRSSDGLGQTHMKLLQEAVARGDKTILIMEDDAVPQPGWNKRWLEQKQWLDSHLDDWEVYNGGAHQLKNCYDVVKLNNSVLLDSHNCAASHFIYLNLKAIDKFLNWNNMKGDIDTFYCYMGFKLYCSYPILAKQADDYSNIINEERKWENTYISNEMHFKRHLGDLYFEYSVKL
jgi:hypothetical protein